jgi:hypothetical protein
MNCTQNSAVTHFSAYFRDDFNHLIQAAEGLAEAGRCFWSLTTARPT